MVESADPDSEPSVRPQRKPPGRPAIRHDSLRLGLDLGATAPLQVMPPADFTSADLRRGPAKDAETPDAGAPDAGAPDAEATQLVEPAAEATQLVEPAADDAQTSQNRPGYTRAEYTAPWNSPAPPPEPAIDRVAHAAITSNGSAHAPGDLPPAWPAETPDTPSPSGGRARRRVLWGTGAGVLLIGGYLAAAWALSGTAPNGTTVAGLPVGGKTNAAIVAALSRAQDQQQGKLQVALGTKRAQLDLADSGLSVDAQATADELAGFSLNPVSLWRHVSGGGAEEVVGASGAPLREDRLETSLRGLAGQLTVKPVDAAVSFTTDGDEPATKVTGGTTGTVLNISRSAQAIRQGWLGGRRPLQLPLETQDPEVTRTEADAAVEKLANPALSGPFMLQVGQVKVPVQPEVFVPALTIRPDRSGTLQLSVDGERLAAAVLKASPQIGKSPKDATIKLKNGKPHIVPGVPGVTLDPLRVGPAVLGALTSKARVASVDTRVEQPRFTTQDAQRLGVKQKVSTFSTILTDNRLRTQNLRVAARTVNGTLVMPGETFSLNDTLGERTAAKGYHQAPAINGGRLVQDYGGGVSQMATTIFNNVFFAGLEDVHHKPHSFYISRYPEGREATVNYPTVDLKWRNDSKYGVLIQANVTNTVNVSFWSTKVWDIEARKSGRTNYRTPGTVYDEKPGCVSQEANPGFDVSVTRIFKKSGKELRRETFRTSYIAEDRVVCGPKPAANATGNED